ncbi:helix-turn-helix domain-containing protein [Alkalibacter saccharofermentans]|uniref:Regulatory protein, luxR family n=1 Tax=Alkalibacter saccharofermentans DSM 14828 TaxID=1120975 RepID=A0A1M4X4V0_9FIRM|nr:helix-turn-helix transcriptional regulator [Alkalibacter saccharofermentans]SHE88383.1 regulatory protein, luxR family [Alkalibacter saccharofermentans DSM 14828]
MGNFSAKSLTVGCFSLFSSWLLAVVFKGPIMYGLIEGAGVDILSYPYYAVALHAAGLISSGFVISSVAEAKKILSSVVALCFVGSLVFLLPYTILWEISIIAMSFASGIFIGGWAFFLKHYIKKENAFEAIAMVLICSNAGFMILSILTVHTNGRAGLLGSLLFLAASFILGSKAKKIEPDLSNADEGSDSDKNMKPAYCLALFIFMITLNSGFMYEVVAPEFGHLTKIASYYFVLPYMLAVFFIFKFPKGRLRSYALYIGLSLLGISYVLFLILDRSIMSYLGINGLMIGALGIFDIFWWSVLAGLFKYYKNPAKVFGLGLGINVIGISAGSMFTGFLSGIYDVAAVTMVAFIVVFVVLMLLPVLNEQLTKVMGYHVFLYSGTVGVASRGNTGMQEELIHNSSLAEFTDREKEIAALLVKGYTYKVIAAELYVSENTIKYHVKNLYSKSEVKNKMDFIKKYRNDFVAG